MYITARQKFNRNCKDWNHYINWIALSNIEEVRTIDSSLNKYVEKCGSIECNEKNLDEVFMFLPQIISDQYYLLMVNTSKEITPTLSDDFKLLGYDLADLSSTSSILNYGPWEGSLLCYKSKLNQFGLLDFDHAKIVKDLLPKEWGIKNITLMWIYGLFTRLIPTLLVRS